MQFETFFQVRGEFVNLDLTLDRIANALNDSSFDESSLGTIIHIAGTNGKGSTAYFLSQIFESMGLKVALFTSPHIIDITERIQINRTPILRNKFDHLFDQMIPHINKHALSYFEAITLLGFKYFESISPDISIIETGMGGKYDATNVLNTKTPVITRISQDHTKYLGTNIYDIIDEKMGIVKDNDTFFLGNNQPFVTAYILKNYGKTQHIQSVTPEETPFNQPHLTFPFNENAALAFSVANAIMTQGAIPQVILHAPPCRFERFGNIIFDGAHNADGLLRILSNIDKPISVVCSFTEERDAATLLNILKTKSSAIFVTELPDNSRSMKVDRIKDPSVIKIKDPADALNKAIENHKENDILITGSLYLCAYLRNIVISAQ